MPPDLTPRAGSEGTALPKYSGEPRRRREEHARGVPWLQSWHKTRCPFHKSFASRCLPGSAGFQPAPEAGETPALPGEDSDDWRCIYETDI